MRTPSKLLIVGIVFLCCGWQCVIRVFEVAAQSLTTAKPVLFLNAQGQRGLVKFDHRLHEAQATRATAYTHGAPAQLACVGCHHTVTNILQREQFAACSTCHQADGQPVNPIPKLNSNDNGDEPNIELSSREIYHRLCITCHRETKQPASTNASKPVPVTCSECHQRDLTVEPALLTRSDLTPPPADDAPTSARVPLPIATEAVNNPTDAPPGFAGKSRIATPANEAPDLQGILKPDRWRIGFPNDPRSQTGDKLNPYNQNVLKGDYPILGQHTFLNVTLESESFANARRIPLPSNASSERPNSSEFFGRGNQFFNSQSFIASIELFHGDTAFKPIDWRIRATPVFNLNYLNTQERGIVNVNPVIGSNRFDQYLGFQELFAEYRLGDTTALFDKARGKFKSKRQSPRFDSTFIRAGIQHFNSDFRGFIFNDYNLGARLFGQFGNNRYNFNAAAFYMLEKDTNSGLNTRPFTRLFSDTRNEFRNQLVVAANLYRQDTKWKGYTTQFSFHYNNDRPSLVFDQNNFIVRPALIGNVREHGVKAYYFGFAGDGHIEKWNINHAFYQVLGRDSFNQIAGRKTNINAQLGALELSLDRDWLRFKGSFFFASGDKNPFDDQARGFDSILDLVEFAGGKFSYWNSQALPFLNTGVLLTSPDSLLPSLRSSKTQGQANFVNPGILVYNTGVEAELTPKLRAITNVNYLHFHQTAPLSQLLFQPNIRRAIGLDYGGGLLYRPLLNENIIITGGASALVPGQGFKDIFSSNCGVAGCGARAPQLYSVFVKVKLTY